MQPLQDVQLGIYLRTNSVLLHNISPQETNSVHRGDTGRMGYLQQLHLYVYRKHMIPKKKKNITAIFIKKEKNL